MPDTYSLLDWLRDRNELVPWADPSRLKRLGSGGEAGYRTDATLSLDRGRMRISGICTSERLDRSREIVRAKGLDVSDHRLNPILTIGHKWREADGIIGRCEVEGRYTVEPGKQAGATPFVGQFFQSGPNAERAAQAFELVDSGVLRGVSVGFIIPPGGTMKTTASDGHPALEIIKSKLFEVTVLPVGDNPDAVVRVVEKGLGGRRLMPVFERMLRPHLPKRRAAVRGGFKREKNMYAMNGANPGMNGATMPQAGMMGQPTPDPAGGMGMDVPQIPQSAQFLSDLNTFGIGMLKYLKERGAIQDSPAVRAIIPQLQLYLSQAFRTVQNAYTQVLLEHPDIPTLPGAGSLLSADAGQQQALSPDLGTGGDAAMAGDAGMVDDALPMDEDGGTEAVETPDDEMPVEGGEMDFGDGIDEDADFGADDFGDYLDDEEDDDDSEKSKSFKGVHYRRAAIRRRSEAILDAFWQSFERELGTTDAMRMKRMCEMADKMLHHLGESDRRELFQHASILMEKAFHLSPEAIRQKRLLNKQAREEAALLSALQETRAELRAAQDEMYRLTGRGRKE